MKNDNTENKFRLCVLCGEFFSPDSSQELSRVSGIQKRASVIGNPLNYHEIRLIKIENS